MHKPRDEKYDEFLKALQVIPPTQFELLTDVIHEIEDYRYRDLRHGTRHTRNQGCTGPLCKKALRDWQRERAAAAHALAGTIPRTYRRSIRLVSMDTVLAPIKAAHDKEFDARREACNSLSPAALQTAGMSRAS